MLLQVIPVLILVAGRVTCDTDESRHEVHKNTKKGIFGCLSVFPSRGIHKRFTRCLKGYGSKYMENVLAGKNIEIDSISEDIRSILKCYHEVIGTLKDGQVFPSTFIQMTTDGRLSGEEEDLKFLEEAAEECIDLITEESPVESLADFEGCLAISINKECSKRGASPSMSLSLTATIVSLAKSNTACESVKIPQEVKTVYKECLTNSSDSKEIEHKKGGHKKRIMMKLLMESKIIKGTLCQFEELGLYSREEGINYTSVVSFLDSFGDWTNDKLKESFMILVKKCAKNSQELPDKKSQEKTFVSCTFPEFASLCGLKNKLAEFMMPLLNEEFRSELINIMKKLIEFFGRGIVMDMVGELIME